jgi:hypothetical protein
MKKTWIAFIGLVCLQALMLAGCSERTPEKTVEIKQIVWEVDNLQSIGGHPTDVLGNPQVVEIDGKKAIMFDGDGDRLLVDNNPLAGADEFTIEIVFLANDVFPANHEPRFFHIEDASNPDRRITIELRLNDKQQWYLDAFIKSETSKYTLIDDSLVHPVGVWAHAAITYNDKVFKSYVNGIEELSAEVEYLPISANSKTSIGARMNQVHWFNGAIAAAAITHEVLPPEKFRLLSFLE